VSPTIDDIMRNAEAFAAIGVSTMITAATGDDPAGWLEHTFAPAIDRLASIEPVRL
jgi:hypothetical protein